jgi:hypothetical protein
MIDPLFIYSFFPAKYLVRRTFIVVVNSVPSPARI